MIGFPKDKDIPYLKKLFVTSLGKHLGDIIINSNIHPTALSKNYYFIRKIFGDKLMLPFLGLDMAKSIVEGIEYIIPHSKFFKSPTLIIHGKADTVTSHLDSISFYDHCSSSDK